MTELPVLPHANLDPEEMTEAQWRESFVAAMVGEFPEHDQTSDLKAYAVEAANSYFADRADYEDAREAAKTDISYWGD
jgi:hypothetical protein